MSATSSYRPTPSAAWLVSAMLVLASASSWAQPAARTGDAPAEGTHRAMMHRMGPGGGHGAERGPKMVERQLDAVGASAEQKTKIRDIMKAAHADVMKQREGQHELHQQMTKLMAAPQIDAQAVEAVRQKMAAGHEVVSKRMTQARLDAAAVLTPEQRQKLAERMAKRMEMMERHHKERRDMEAPRG